MSIKLYKDLYTMILDAKYTDYGNDVNMCFKESKDKETLIILFEESNGKLDWKHNFMFKKRPYKDMAMPYKVHSGFLKCWKQVEDIVIAKISNTAHKKIIIGGYSHGAALAVLCHECCWYNRPDIREKIMGYGFGCPRVYGSFKIKPSLIERWNNFFVIRNHNDIVTHVPPRIFGYTHVGKILQIGIGSTTNFVDSHRPSSYLKSLV